MFDLTPVTVLMRWMHLASTAVLVGGAVFARLVLVRALASAPSDTRGALEDRAALAFRPLVVAAVAGLLVSGIYQFYSSTGHSPRYHILFGFKMALALHVFATAILVSRPGNPRRARMLSGLAVSGLLIVLIAAVLRQIY